MLNWWLESLNSHESIIGLMGDSPSGMQKVPFEAFVVQPMADVLFHE